MTTSEAPTLLSKLITLSLFLALLSPVLLVSADQQATLSGPVMDWLAATGLASWERTQFAIPPDAYNNQFIGLSLMGALLLVPTIGCYYVFNQRSIRRHLELHEDAADKNMIHLSVFRTKRTRALFTMALLVLVFFVGRSLAINMMATIDEAEYTNIGYTRPSKGAIQSISPLLMYMNTLMLTFTLSILIGHFFSTRNQGK